MKQKIVVKKVVHEKIDAKIFDCGLTLREISRRTGLDVAYLSRIRSGKSPITEVNLERLLKVTRKEGSNGTKLNS